MITEDGIRSLVDRAEEHFQKFGPVYALTELLLALKKELPVPIKELPVEKEDVQTFAFSPEEITAMQNGLIGRPQAERRSLRPSHL